MFLLQNVSKKAPAGYHFGLPLGGITGRALTLPERLDLGPHSLDPGRLPLGLRGRLGPMGDRLGDQTVQHGDTILGWDVGLNVVNLVENMPSARLDYAKSFL